MANSKIPNITLADTLNTQRLRINQLLDSVGDVSTLTTTERNITEAINEHDAELGVIDAYNMGTSAGTVSGAIQELDGRLDSINDTQLSTPKIYVSDSNATNHIKGTVNIDTNLNVGGSVDIDTDLTVHGNLVVDGTTAISAGANGEINLGDGLQDSDTVIFNAEIGSDIVPGSDDQYDIGSSSKEFRHGYFDGTVNADELQSDSATIGTLKVTDLTNNRVVIVGAGDEIEDDANFTFDGNVLSVGNTSIDKDAVGINTTGLEADSATITGNLRVDGNVDLGNASTDTVSITGQVDTDVVPSTNNERSLGSNSKQWKHLHVNGTGYIDEVSADSATLGTLKVTDLTSGRIVIGGTGGEITDDADLTYNTTSDTLAVSNIDIGTSAALASAKVEDLTTNRIVIAGTSGELEDDANFTFDGNTFSVGSTTVDKGATGINTTGLEADSANISNDVSVGGDLQVTGGFTVGGAVTFTGETRYTASHQVLLDGVAVDNNNRAGLAVDRPSNDSAVIQWNELGDYWEAGVTTDLGRLALQGDSAQFLRVDGTTGSFDNVNVSVDLDVTGNLNADGITTLDSTTVDGDLEVTGNFTVGGTTTYINTETVTIDDNIIVLNNNATGTPATDQDAGIEVERGNSANIQLLWDESAKYWVAATDTSNTLSRIATANWLDATAPITYNSTSGNISHGTSGVSAGTYGSVTVDTKGHVTAGTNPAFDNYVSWTAKDSAGDTYTITSGDILTIKGDGDIISTDWAGNDILKIAHAKVGAASQNNSGDTYIQDVTVDAYGHVTSMATSTVTTPSNSTITISPREGLKTGGNFTLNAASAKTIYIDIDSAELRDDFIEKLYFDKLMLNSVSSSYQGNLRSANGSFRLSDDTSDATSRPVSLGLMNTDTSLGDGSLLASANFEGENSSNERVSYAKITGTAVDVSNGTEDGQLQLITRSGGNDYVGLSLSSGNATIRSRQSLDFESGYLDTQGRFRFANSTPEANTSKPSFLEIWNNNPDPTDNMFIGQIDFAAEDINSQYKVYSLIEGQREGSVNGSIGIKVLNSGVYRTAFYADSDTTISAADDVYIRPTGDLVHMQGVTSGEQLDFSLGTSTQSITASDALTLAASSGNMVLDASGDITLDADGNQIYFKNGGGGDTWTWTLNNDASGSFIAPNSFTIEANAGDLTMFADGGDISLTADGGNVYMRSSTSNEQINFAMGTTAQQIIASDDLILGATGEMTLYTTTGGDIDLNPNSGRIGLFGNGTERAGFDVVTADTLKVYTGQNFGTLNSTFSGDDLTVQGDVTSVSDVRTKENIETVANSLDLVSQLRGVWYNKIGKDERKVGVIAQEVEEVLPEVVHTDTEGMKAVDYGKMVGVLIEAIKDLKAEIEELKAQ